MKKPRTPAKRFPVSEYIRDEMVERGWCAATLARESMLTETTVGELLSGKRRVTRLIAHCLGRAFGTGPEVWTELQKVSDEAKP